MAGVGGIAVEAREVQGRCGVGDDDGGCGGGVDVFDFYTVDVPGGGPGEPGIVGGDTVEVDVGQVAAVDCDVVDVEVAVVAGVKGGARKGYVASGAGVG